ncbi:MAG: hypothetical protein LBQ54_05855 [Planctomycetaceae bacterium]|jgi:hypothetical protein|nr:hypothetical protein [Planctomycetaceae bacterium]
MKLPVKVLLSGGMILLSLWTVFADVPLQEGFQNPPESVRVGVYWYWINDNISRDGVVKDLEAMAEVGITRAFIGNIGEQGGGYGQHKLLSDEWWNITHETLKTAARLGIEIGMFNSPGWSQSGGPWVKPEQSMRYLAFSETKVLGPKTFREKLAAPGENFQDVKTLAFPAPKAEASAASLDNPVINAETPAVTLKTGFVPRSLTIEVNRPSSAKIEIQWEKDNTFQTVKTVTLDRSNASLSVGFLPFAPSVFSLPEANADISSVRLVFSDFHGSVSKIEVSAIPKVEYFAEKELAKMCQNPHPNWGTYMWREPPAVKDSQLVTKPEQIVDISGFLEKDGTLHWDVPEGEWIIQRTGMLTTGVTNAPATREAKGLETDKMSKQHIASHFDAYMGKILERIPADDRKAFKVVVLDSYETGGQNWTDGMIDEFKQRYGYDPVPFLPVLNGRVVGNPDLSDRFLWDLRRMVADKVAYDYVAGLRDVSNQHGLTTWLECYGHWGFPGEFLQYGGQSDGVAGEFWNEGDLGSIENRAASSCAHIYGKQKVTAESFTASGRAYERYPALLKKRCDWSYTEGINETLMHLYIQQPDETRTPGINAWFGTEFNRKNTWFYEMKPFVAYMRRCMFLLQQGLHVADAAYFIGEDAPKMIGVCDPPLPKGYSFDYINGEILRDKIRVQNRKLVLPHGTEYRILVLPKQDTMRPELLRKIKRLVEDGAVVLGNPPKKSPSMQNHPACDEEVQKLAAELWGHVDGEKVKSRQVGKGLILSGMTMQEAFDLIPLKPDCGIRPPDILYVHRTTGDGEIYFVTNQTGKPVSFSPQFRVEGLVPELWDADTGEMRTLPAFVQKEDITEVPLKLDAFGSAFVVFRNRGTPKAGGVEDNFPTPQVAVTLDGAWKVQFDASLRGPEQPVTLEKLSDWTASQEDAVKYYSGTATYTTTFDLEKVDAGKRYFAHLGTVHVIASVKINGQYADTVWTAPWQADITKGLKTGTNQLEVSVTNTWVNRLIGDSRLPEPDRKTWLTANPFKPDSKLAPSGLLGPVTIQYVQKQPE